MEGVLVEPKLLGLDQRLCDCSVELLRVHARSELVYIQPHGFGVDDQLVKGQSRLSALLRHLEDAIMEGPEHVLVGGALRWRLQPSARPAHAAPTGIGGTPGEPCRLDKSLTSCGLIVRANCWHAGQTKSSHICTTTGALGSPSDVPLIHSAGTSGATQ